MDLITTPRAAARAQQLGTALPATQQQRHVSSPPQVVPQALLPFPGPHDAAAAAFRQDCWGLRQQPWDCQEPCAALKGPTSNYGILAASDSPAAWDAHQLLPRFDDTSAEQLHELGSLPGLAPQHISTGFSSGTLPAAGAAELQTGFSCAATASWSLSSTGLQQLPPVLERFQPLPRSSLCAGMGCSASPACLVAEACSTALPRPANAGSLSAGAESAATVAAVLAAAAQPHAAPAGQGTLQCTPSLSIAASIDRFHAALLTGGGPAVHLLPLPAARDIGSAGSATPAQGSVLGQDAAQQAAMLAAASGGALLPAFAGPTAPTAGHAVSAVPGGCGSGGGSSSRDSAFKFSGPVMKPPAARLTQPASGGIVKPPRAAQVQRRRSGLEEALQASAIEAEENKVRHSPAKRICRGLAGRQRRLAGVHGIQRAGRSTHSQLEAALQPSGRAALPASHRACSNMRQACP